MSHPRFRVAVGPLRRPADLPAAASATVDGLIAELQPVDPMYCIRPQVLRATAAEFVQSFPGDVLYAVKCNPEPAVLRALWKGGVRHFDCASLAEIRLVRQLFPQAGIHYMHPIKAPQFIREAYGQHGVRDFSLDSEAELTKILAATDQASDLGLYIRLALPKGDAVLDLSGKFGASLADAVALLRRARPLVARLGLCFHVGSQCLEPAAYERALALVGQVIAEAGVAIDGIDVGGGFPARYPGQEPPDFAVFVAAITRGVAALGLPSSVRLWCEPGRALVAAAGSVVVQVQARKGDVLYLNDGAYGSLSDAGPQWNWRFPARLVRAGGGQNGTDRLIGFSFYGPTCDSADHMVGPFLLPADVEPGDWIELGQLGAYATCLRTGFNGFERTLLTEVSDPPLAAQPTHAASPLTKPVPAALAA